MESPSLNDESWLKKFRDGDEEALKALFVLCGAHLFYFAKTIIGDKDLAGEIVSASFVRTWRNRAGFQTLEIIKNDLCRNTKNACLDHFQTTAGNDKTNIHPLFLENDCYETLLHRIVYADLLKIMLEEIEKLPEPARKIFQMSFFEKLQPEEIAEKMDMLTHHVKSNKKRTLELLRLSIAKKNIVLSMPLFEIICLALSYSFGL
ncbi:MAG TPA: sigma-70 family RNA polymerase sigma factor [Puia sp.]|nr:sigma-70 family RNA polymerase sigma factor [Puia sp.]